MTVYPAGKKKALGASEAQDAQFVLPAGTYDMLVESGGAEEWLKDLAMVDGNVVSQDVVFDFGTLALTVVQGGATPKVDIVIYPAGQRQTWADYRARTQPLLISAPGNISRGGAARFHREQGRRRNRDPVGRDGLADDQPG